MNLSDLQENLIGVWTGENLLHLSWLTPTDYQSLSELTVATAVKGKFLTFNYQWSHENAAHEGLLLVGFDAEQKLVNASWADSWHSSVKPLALSGTIDEAGAIDVRGNYEVPNHPDWSWRIVVKTIDDGLQMTMYNVSPEGAEDLAVRADYQRVRQQSND